MSTLHNFGDFTVVEMVEMLSSLIFEVIEDIFLPLASKIICSNFDASVPDIVVSIFTFPLLLATT